MATFTSWDTELCHYGILGQRKGIRRFQNEDGSLTPAGRERYGTAENFNKDRRQLLMKTKAKYLSDAELKEVTARKEAENKYREMNRSPLAKSAENLFNKISDSREKAAARKEREEDRRIRTLESINSVKRAKEQTAQEKARAQQKKSESVIANSKSKINETKAQLQKAKNERKAQKFWANFQARRSEKLSRIRNSEANAEKQGLAVLENHKQETLAEMANSKAWQEYFKAAQAYYGSNSKGK